MEEKTTRKPRMVNMARISPFEAACRWKKIQEYTNKITDPILKESILAEYQQRAIDEWGFCPDNKQYKAKKPDLEPWAEAFLEKVKKAVEYGVFKVDEQVEKEARTRMRMFIEKGGRYSDLPEYLQTPDISVLYTDTMIELIKYWKEQLDFLEKDQKNCLQGKNDLV